MHLHPRTNETPSILNPTQRWSKISILRVVSYMPPYRHPATLSRILTFSYVRLQARDLILLHRDEIKAIYDRIGERQDRGAYYEDAAILDMVVHADFPNARRVWEFGSGTGRVAAWLLDQQLPPDATYYAVDLSSTMVRLSRSRLRAWSQRTMVIRAASTPYSALADRSVDRFVSMYVLDILSPDQIDQVLAEAHRVLTSDGLVCLVSLTHGATPYALLKSWGWRLVYALQPRWVGGCRPISLYNRLQDAWDIRHHNIVTVAGMSSEVVVASPR